ncbi:MAG: CvpA family protein [Desulfobulbaceae bacterium]|nr:CvpA family protein [Desulfobulbaceae bacterium]
MTSIDIAVLVIIALFTIRGAWIGFIRQLAFIAALILAFLVAGAFSRQLAGFLKPLDASPQLNFLLIYAALLLAVYLLVTLVGLAMSKMMKVTMLGGFDRVLGGVFGLVKGIFLATLLFMAVAGIMSESAEFLRRSFSFPYLSSSAKVLSWFIRDQDLRNQLRPKEAAIGKLVEQAREILPGKTKEEAAKAATQSPPAPPAPPAPVPAPRYQPASRAGATPKK